MRQLFKRMKKLINNIDKLLLILSAGLCIFGLLNIVTASSREAVVEYGLPMYYYFGRQLMMIIIALVGSFIIINLNTKSYKDVIPFVFGIALVLVCLLFVMGVEVGGALNWLPLPIVGNIQPGELAKPVIIVYLGVLFEQNYRLFRSEKQDEETRKKTYIKCGIILIVGCLIPIFTFLQKDFGTMFITVAIFGVMFLTSPIRKKYKINIIVLIVVVGILGCFILQTKQGYILSNVQKTRLTSFLNPCSKYENTGYQICNGYIAINDGGLFGLGIGKSKQKYSYIPAPHTDSVFAIIGEEYGVIKSSFIFLAYIGILYRVLKISSIASTLRGKYICLGVATYLFMHILINLGGLFGVMPLTGVPLPFLSYGGTFIISLICSLAVVQRVYYETKTQRITL